MWNKLESERKFQMVSFICGGDKPGDSFYGLYKKIMDFGPDSGLKGRKEFGSV